MFNNSLSSQVRKLEESIRAFPYSVTAVVRLPIHDDVPDGYVLLSENKNENVTTYEKVLGAKDGIATKSVRVIIPE